MNKKLLLFIFFLALVALGFWVKSNSLDSDFGWHIKTGQLILQKGVPYQDWYSYTMPDFPWFHHEWLIDVLMYKFYSYVGFSALLLVFICLYAISFFIIKNKNDNPLFFIFIVAFGYLTTISFLGIRPQLLTITFLSVLWKIIDKFLKSPSRLIYFLPILFVVWVNLHAGFFMGLFILFLITILELLKKSPKILKLEFLQGYNFVKQPWIKVIILCIVTLLSLGATFVNPYGIRTYDEVFRTIGDNYLKFHIAEWIPLLIAGTRPLTYLYIGIFLIFFIVCRKKIEFNKVVITLIALLSALLSIRNYLIFVILSVSFMNEGFPLATKKINLKEGYKKLSYFDKKLIILSAVIILSLMVVSAYTVLFPFSRHKLNFYYGDNFPDQQYPKNAIAFLKTLPLEKNLFNDYGWGGYLIWQLPERKVFIDGRMPSWRHNDRFVFGDYIKITEEEENFKEVLDRYNVELALIGKSDMKKNDIDENSSFGKFTKKYPWFSHHIIGIDTNKSIGEKLEKQGWKIIYQDDIAVILQR